MISFSKYHGCGNSFIIVREEDLIKGRQKAGASGMSGALMQRVDPLCEDDFMACCSAFAKKACDVSIGIGADGLIVVRQKPALEMIFFNLDGSRAPMCGNGIRCFAHYCYEENICKESSYPVKTLAGEMMVKVTDAEHFKVKINMGKPIFSLESIGVDSLIYKDLSICTESSTGQNASVYSDSLAGTDSTLYADFQGKSFLGRSLKLQDGSSRIINSLFMGTVHTVVFTDDLDSEDTEALGKEICNHPVFKEKTNVNFIEVIDDKTLRIKTYERGVGMTLACGTGACASVVVASMQGLCQTKSEVILPLGRLMIEINDDGNVYMEGPSVKIIDGSMEMSVV